MEEGLIAITQTNIISAYLLRAEQRGCYASAGQPLRSPRRAGNIFAMLGCDRVNLPMSTCVVDLDRVSAKACQSTLAQSLTGPDAIHLGISSLGLASSYACSIRRSQCRVHAASCDSNGSASSRWTVVCVRVRTPWSLHSLPKTAHEPFCAAVSADLAIDIPVQS